MRFVFGCNNDQEDDPRLQPFLKMNVTRASVERAGDGRKGSFASTSSRR